jgi:hypothetical protein
MRVLFQRLIGGGLVVGAAALFAGGCTVQSDTAVATATPAHAPRLQVVNRSGQDMDIFLVQGAQAVRLGVAEADRTTDFPLSSTGPDQGPMHFEARPIDGYGIALNTEATDGSAEGLYTMEIPPS